MLTIENFLNPFHKQVFNVDGYNEDGSVLVTYRNNSTIYTGTLYPQQSIEDVLKENALLKEKISNLLGSSLNNS